VRGEAVPRSAHEARRRERAGLGRSVALAAAVVVPQEEDRGGEDKGAQDGGQDGRVDFGGGGV
jgi:hypothetical protein